MIIVSVSLLSAVTGEHTELGRVYISNEGGTRTQGSYMVEVLRGRSSEDFAKRTVLKVGHVEKHPRLSQHVWNLVAKALHQVGYAHQ